jgi:drug/metabolite transporter (DMT)-like permease
VLWLERKRLGIARSDLARLGLLCLLGFVLNKAAEFGGLSLTTASDTAVLIASEGIFTAALGWLILREPIRGRSVGGLALGAAGVYLVVERGLVLPHVGHGAQLVGDLLIVLALLLEGLYTVVGKATLVRYSAFFITAGSIIGSLTVWIPASLIDIAHAGLPRMPLASWGGVVYLAIGATVLAYVGWMLALRYASAGIAAATLYIQPLLGALLAVVLLGEHLLLSTVVGGVCIVMGVWQAGRGAETRQIELTHEETLSI